MMSQPIVATNMLPAAVLGGLTCDEGSVTGGEKDSVFTISLDAKPTLTVQTACPSFEEKVFASRVLQLLKSAPSEPALIVGTVVPIAEQTIVTRAHAAMPRLTLIENLSVITHFRFLPTSISAAVHKHSDTRGDGRRPDDNVGFDDLEESTTSDKSTPATDGGIVSECSNMSTGEKVAETTAPAVDECTDSACVRKTVLQKWPYLRHFLQIFRWKNNRVGPCG
jgi:hypothetical protein